MVLADVEWLVVLEWVAAAIGLGSVICSIYEHIAVWPLTIVSSALYFGIFLEHGFYADAPLQLFYIGLAMVGLRTWKKKNKSGELALHIRRATSKEMVFGFVAVALSTAVYGSFAASLPNASFPYVDAFTASLSILAQWFLAKKILENWALWIFGDAVMTAMYATKGLLPTTILYGVLLVAACVGARQWRKQLQMQVSSIESAS